MSTSYSAQPELAEPRRFLRDAVDDLRRSMPIARRLFAANLRARFRRTQLGYLWLLAPALAVTVIAVYLQHRHIVGVRHTALPYALYVLAGILLWQVFVDALTSPSQQLTEGRAVVARIPVPYEALILAGFLEVLVNAAVRVVVLLVAVVVSGTALGATVVLVPVGVLALALLGLAIGVWLAPFGLLYDDVARGVLLATAFWIFLTPVFYAPPGHGVLELNPVSPLLDTTRGWLTSSPRLGGALLVTLLAAAVLTAGWLFGRLARPHVAARLG
jgi:homopolymeric O-antigen transport system permease protein